LTGDALRVRLRVLREEILAELTEPGELQADAAQLAAVTAPERHHMRALGSVLHDWYGGRRSGRRSSSIRVRATVCARRRRP
jgi:hypothetical protein